MERRKFAKTALVIAVGSRIPSKSWASAQSELKFPGIIYTSEDQGKWVGKAVSHAPSITIEGKNIVIGTAHPMTEEHFIVRHTLVSEDGKVIGEKTFYPSDKNAVSSHTLPEDHGANFYATSFCNKHDFWIARFKLE
jgi:superoxide reductase